MPTKMKKTILRIYDFIKSWQHYPKMVAKLRDMGIDYRESRLAYASWHCRSGKLSDTGYENLKPNFKDVPSGWKSIYDRKPIERGKM